MSLIDEDDGFKFIYPEDKNENKNVSKSPRKSRRTIINPIKIIRKDDNQMFKPGDIVTVTSSDGEESYLAMIKNFEYNSRGVMMAMMIWFVTESDKEVELKDDWFKNEVYITGDADRNPLDVIEDLVKIISIKQFKIDYDHHLNDEELESIFICRYAVNRESKIYSKKFDWNEIFKLNDENKNEIYENEIENFMKYIQNITIDINKSPRRGKKIIKTPMKSNNHNTPFKSQDRRKSKPTPKLKLQDEVNDPDIEFSDDSSDEYQNNNDDDSEDETDDSEIYDSDYYKEQKKKIQQTPKHKRHLSNPNTPSPKKQKLEKIMLTPHRSIYARSQLSTPNLPNRLTSPIKNLISPSKSPFVSTRYKLQIGKTINSLPCREEQFSTLYYRLESSINSLTGSCIYISGTPGTGKTATVREVINQLLIKMNQNEINQFNYIEINGLKLTSPYDAYEMLWYKLHNQRVSSANAILLLEKQFKFGSSSNSKLKNDLPLVVLMDELDQVITKNQSIMYNFFNWPTYKNSKLIIIAVANTMDLPERILTNKISSRIGLTRIQFPGYNYKQLETIIKTRLKSFENDGLEIGDDSIGFASRKVASVSGDARRALTFCRRAIEIAELEYNNSKSTNKNKKVKVIVKHIQKAINESTNSPISIYLKHLPLSYKIFLSAILGRYRKTGIIECSIGDVIDEMYQLININLLSSSKFKIKNFLYESNKKIRINGFFKIISELIDCGIIIVQNNNIERSSFLKLIIRDEEIKSAFKGDPDLAGMV